MELNLKRPLLFFDIESTGLNIASDSIAELSFVKIFPGNEQRIKTWRVCPWDYEKNCQRPMNPAAQAVNGISDEELSTQPRFFEIIDEVIEWLSDADLSGYNSAKFDLPMLAEEIERVRAAFPAKPINIDLHEKKMVDVQVIYHKMEPRNLKAAYRFYVGGDFENAHAAEADTLATYAVLKGELDKYPEGSENGIKNDVEWLANFTETQKTVDYAGRIVLNADKVPCISFGKHKGKTCREVYMTEPSYFAWIAQGDFTLDTKRQFAALRQQFEQEKRAASKKPLDDRQVSDAAEMLRNRWGGNGRSGSLF